MRTAAPASSFIAGYHHRTLARTSKWTEPPSNGTLRETKAALNPYHKTKSDLVEHAAKLARQQGGREMAEHVPSRHRMACWRASLLMQLKPLGNFTLPSSSHTSTRSRTPLTPTWGKASSRSTTSPSKEAFTHMRREDIPCHSPRCDGWTWELLQQFCGSTNVAKRINTVILYCTMSDTLQQYFVRHLDPLCSRSVCMAPTVRVSKDLRSLDWLHHTGLSCQGYCTVLVESCPVLSLVQYRTRRPYCAVLVKTQNLAEGTLNHIFELRVQYCTV